MRSFIICTHPLNAFRQIKSRRMRWAGHVVHMGEQREAHKVLVGEPEGKRPLRRPRRRCQNRLGMDLSEIDRGVTWVQLAQDRGRWWVLVNVVMYLWVLAPRS
jgi:hypothetical protein